MGNTPIGIVQCLLMWITLFLYFTWAGFDWSLLMD